MIAFDNDVIVLAYRSGKTDSQIAEDLRVPLAMVSDRLAAYRRHQRKEAMPAAPKRRSYLPTEEQIRNACAEIRADWSDAERLYRYLAARLLAEPNTANYGRVTMPELCCADICTV